MPSNFDSMNSGASASQSEAGSSSESCEQAAADWIELELIDHNDKPVGEVAYTVTLPDTQQRQGMLTEAGKVRIEKIPTGKCEVTFGPSQSETQWIEIELIDEADRPIPGEKYSVTLPDGKEVKGNVDRGGRAIVQELAEAGDCKVTFETGEDGPDFIEVELVNEDGKAVSGERYSIAIPDGRRITGILDSAGKARIENIPGGTCSVKFLGDQPIDLTIILKDPDEKPIPGADYEATLSNGRKLTGKLDGDGKVRVLNAPPGQVKLSFELPESDEQNGDA